VFDDWNSWKIHQIVVVVVVLSRVGFGWESGGTGS
jgi:hypothetical protein